KRRAKIDELLETPEYSARWATRLCDYTGNNSRELRYATLVRGEASQHWYDWIYQRVADNTPYDDLVEGIVLGQSRRPGQTYLEYCEEMSHISQNKEGASFADRPTMEYYWA